MGPTIDPQKIRALQRQMMLTKGGGPLAVMLGQLLEVFKGVQSVGIKGDRGAQGEQGETGPEGKRGGVGPRGFQGPHGPEGRQGPQGREGPIGRQGPQGDVGPRGFAGPQGPKGDDTGAELVRKINESDELIDASKIKNLPTIIERRDLPSISVFGNGRGGGSKILFRVGNEVYEDIQTIVLGTGIAVVRSAPGQLALTSTAGAGSGVTVETPPEPVFVDPETPSNSTVVFTVSARPKWVVADGITYYEGAGYTYSSLQITMEVAPSIYIRAII